MQYIDLDIHDPTEDTGYCRHCHRHYSEHNYIKDSGRFACPERIFSNSMYGYFHCKDPRDFTPDFEANSPAEIRRHQAACDLWNLCDKNDPVLEMVRQTWRTNIYGLGVSSFFENEDGSYSFEAMPEYDMPNQQHLFRLDATEESEDESEPKLLPLQDVSEDRSIVILDDSNRSKDYGENEEDLDTLDEEMCDE